MKLKIHLEQIDCEIEATPSEAADFLLALKSGQGAEIIPPVKKALIPAVEPRSHRQEVLETMRFLKRQGRNVAHISEIQVVYRQMFPKQSTQIDQILRDLVNKTGQLRRVGRGMFAIQEG